MNQIKHIILLPLILVLISIPLEGWSLEISRILKFIAMSAIVLNTFCKRQKNIYVFVLPFLVIYLTVLIFYNNIQLRPALEDGMRYLIPFIAIIYGIQLKSEISLVIKIILIYVVFNNFYQLINGAISLVFLKEISFNRATGFVGFFDFFGFINLVGLILINEVKIIDVQRYRRYLEVFFIVFILWSLSLKIIILFFIYAAIRNRKTIIIPFILWLMLLLFKNQSVINGFWLRVNRYLIYRDSARNESYRVAFNNLNEFWFIGKGPGTFGGPASTEHGSVLYENYNFNWFGELGLATTDTYYPHLIVELGLVFGVIYLFFIIIVPILLSKLNIVVIQIIFFVAINSIFSFALNSISYCFFSFLIVGLYQENNEYLLENRA